MKPAPWLLSCVLVIAGGCSSGSDEAGSSSVEEGTVEVGGSEVRCQTAGGVDAPTLTFLFLHGAAFTSDTWVDNGILEAAGEGSSFQSIAIDLPGYGESPSTSVATADFVPAVMSAMGLEPEETIIVSPSMSGGFSLAALQTGSLDDLAGFVGVAPVGSSDFADSLASPLDVPAVAVWGDEDGNDPKSSADALARGFVGGETVVVADAGHAAYNQQPAVFTDLLRDFANDLPACDGACLS